MAEAPIGTSFRPCPFTQTNCSICSPRWRHWISQGWICRSGMNGVWNLSTLPLNRCLQNFPEFQYPSIVGRPILRSEEQAGDITVKDIMCGDEAAAARSMLQISYPVQFLQAP